MKPVPILQALILAERVYTDTTGKKIIAGTFNCVKFSRRPPVAQVEVPGGGKQLVVVGGGDMGSPCAYASLTDICDGTKLQLQFVNLTKNRVLFGTDITISGAPRLSTVELVLPLPKLPISEPGTYAFEIVCEGEILGSCRITAEEIHEADGVSEP